MAVRELVAAPRTSRYCDHHVMLTADRSEDPSCKSSWSYLLTRTLTAQPHSYAFCTDAAWNLRTVCMRQHCFPTHIFSSSLPSLPALRRALNSDHHDRRPTARLSMTLTLSSLP